MFLYQDDSQRAISEKRDVFLHAVQCVSKKFEETRQVEDKSGKNDLQQMNSLLKK